MKNVAVKRVRQKEIRFILSGTSASGLMLPIQEELVIEHVLDVAPQSH